MNALSVRGLCKRYGSFALRDVSFDVAPGSITGFIGRNGAGKTTTLKSLLDFVHPDAGEALFFGRPLSADEFGVKQAVGFASGGFGFYPLKRLRTVTDVTRRFYPSWDETAYRRYLALFALDENKRVKELSEGMKVKYALALALSHRARLLVLDEPTSGLDPVSRDELLEIFLQLAQDEGISILFSTHITSDLETRYDWKKSVGPVENRPLNENRWQYTFTHRFFPDYYQSYGLGFYEYFLLSEEMGAAPLPILNCGLSCQYQNNDPKAHVAVCDLDNYIQDALDLIEFANGDVNTTWGKVRADMGHSAPFNLKFIGIGNEQWGKEYPERLEPFIKAIRKAHPEIKIVGSSGPNSEGKEFDYLWPEMKRLKVDLVDEHFYRPESWFLAPANMPAMEKERNGIITMLLC